VNAIELAIRRASRCGMTEGTVMCIEFISGFELFNTRPYHNYETWVQGWRVTGLGVAVDNEGLDAAIAKWVELVKARRAGEEIPRWHQLALHKRDGEPYRAAKLLPDWIEVGTAPSWKDGMR
jgi:hypothetical protein